MEIEEYFFFGLQFDLRVMKIFIFPNFITLFSLLEYISIYHTFPGTFVFPLGLFIQEKTEGEYLSALRVLSNFVQIRELGTKLHAMETRFYRTKNGKTNTPHRQE